MRPPASPPPSKNRYPNLIVAIGLFSGMLITALIWLQFPDQLITPLSWLSLSLIGLGSYLSLRRLTGPRPRGIMALAALAAVSLVYLFPELFGPACGGMPRAFALNCPRECQVNECTKWVAGPSAECPNPGSGGGCCLTYETTCDPNCDPPPPPDQPPAISGTLTCTNWGQNSWCIGSSTLQLTATEPQGKQVLISGDVAGTPFACPAGIGSASCSIPLPQGTGVANYLATSITGLTAPGSATYKHDSTLPLINGSLSGTSGDNGWFISSVMVNASASDPEPGSGLSAQLYKLDGGGWVSYTGPLSISDGIHTLSLRATDAAGNSVDTNQTIQVDSITPALDLTVTGASGTDNWYRSNVQVSATVSDLGSGLSAVEYDLDGRGWTNYISPLELSDGIHNLSLRAMDAAGNSTGWAQSFQVDTLTPILDLTVDGTLGASGWYTTPVQISLAASDPGSSGLSALEYNLDAAGWKSNGTPLELRDGLHSLEVRAIDGAGNLTSGAQTFHVDIGAPTLEVNVNGTKGASPWYVSFVQVEAIASDVTSALSSLEVKVDGSDWSVYNAALAFGDGPHSYRFRARDNAGNLTLTAIQALQVDTIPPTISMPKSWDVGEMAQFQLQDSGSGLASVRLVIDDEDERYPKVSWEKTLASYNFDGKIKWDGRFKDGSLALPGGDYFATLKVTDIAGNESRMAGQIKVPLLSYVDPFIDSSDGLVTGTEETDPIVTFIPDSDTDEQPTSLSSEENASSTLSFGGDSNNTGVPSEQSALNLGGVNNGAAQPSDAQTGKTSFSAGGQSTSPINNSPSNVLWGATATAAIGAFSAEILRRKQEEEAKAAEKAARRESRAESNYRKKIKANKLAKLEVKWAAERELAEQRKEAEQRKQDAINARLTRKEDLVEAEMRAYGNKPQELGESYYKYMQQKAFETYRAEEVAAQTKITAPPKEEKSWWERSIEWADKHQTEIALAVGVAAGVTAIILSGGAATPLVAAAWIAGSAIVAGGVVAGGTVGLNAYYGRPLSTNVLHNFAFAAGAAAVTTSAGFVLNAVSPVVTRSVASFCKGHVTTCAVAGPAFKTVDYLWTAHDALEAERTLNDPKATGIERLTAGVTLALTTWGEALEPDELLPVSLPLDDIARREITEKFAEIVSTQGSEAGLEYLVTILGKDAPISKVINAVDDADSVIKLLTTLDKDVLDYAIKQGPDAIKAMSKWDKKLLEEYGIELALRSGQDAKALQATKELIELGPIDPKNLTLKQRELINTIAENSVQQINNGHVVVGKWLDYDSGFSGYALDNSAVHYSQHPDLWPMLGNLGDNQGEVAWLINQNAIRSQIEKGKPFEYTLQGIEPGKVDREIAAIEAIWNNAPEIEILDSLALPGDKIPYRMQELKELYQAGYKYTFDEVYNSLILIKP